MLIKGLKFFSKTNVENDYCLAAYHRPDSITWRWALYLKRKPYKCDNKRAYFSRKGDGIMWGFYIPFIGKIDFQTQQNMFWK